MASTASLLLDRLLYDLSRSFPVAAFVRALGDPAELSAHTAAQDFWQDQLRSWMRADYGARLERVLRAYKALLPEDPLLEN